MALTFVGAERDRAAFTDSLRELLGRAEIQVAERLTDAPLPRDGLIASVFVSWKNITDVVVRIEDARGAEVLVRQFRALRSRALIVEAASHVVQSVVDELANPYSPPTTVAHDGGEVHGAVDAGTTFEMPIPQSPETVARKPLPVSSPPRPASDPSQPDLAVEVGLFGSLRGFGSTAPTASPGVGVVVSANFRVGPVRLGPWLSGGYVGPFVVEGGLVDLGVQPFGAQVGLAVQLLRTRRLCLAAELGGGADGFASAARSAQIPGTRLAPPGIFLTPVLHGSASLHVALGRNAGFWLELGADVDLYPIRWTTEIGPKHEDLFRPWSARPLAKLGLSLDVLGALAADSAGTPP